MTVIACVRKNNALVVAADTLATFGDADRCDPANVISHKITRIGDSVVGGSGWGVYDDIFRDHLADRTPPTFADEHEVFEFFLELWRVLHDKYPFVNDQANSKDSPFGSLDSTFIIANRHGIFRISCDLSVTRYERYCALGSGSDYAQGAIHAVYNDPGMDAEAIARKAVEAGICFDVYCGGEVEILPVSTDASSDAFAASPEHS